jgi:hypothetical protein
VPVEEINAVKEMLRSTKGAGDQDCKDWQSKHKDGKGLQMGKRGKNKQLLSSTHFTQEATPMHTRSPFSSAPSQPRAYLAFDASQSLYTGKAQLVHIMDGLEPFVIVPTFDKGGVKYNPAKGVMLSQLIYLALAVCKRSEMSSLEGALLVKYLNNNLPSTFVDLFSRLRLVYTVQSHMLVSL